MKVTPIKIAIHQDGVNAIFGSGVTYIEIDDTAGGGFLKVTQNTNDAAPPKNNKCILLESDELTIIAREGRKLLATYRKNGNEK